MRTIRWLAVMIGAALLIPGAAAHAQGRGMGGGGGRRPDLLQGITLTDAQKTSVDSIHTAYRSQFEALGQPGPDTRDQRRQLFQKENADIRGLLTPDQQTQFDKNLADAQSRMQSRGGGGNT